MDYDPAAVAALAADAAASPSAARAPQDAAAAAAPPDAGAALRCVDHWASSARHAVPVRIIEASYRGAPAYLGVASQATPGGGVPRVLVWVLARQGCELISFSQRAA
jgi:hypothetical protein